MIVYMRETDGGFLCGDTSTGRTAYAYPMSTNANRARVNAMRVAGEMMRKENAFTRFGAVLEDGLVQDRYRMAILTSGGKVS